MSWIVDAPSVFFVGLREEARRPPTRRAGAREKPPTFFFLKNRKSGPQFLSTPF
jgi:hypothetical protein